MTLNMMFKHPELYHAGISIAAVPNMRLYDTIYQERYMGLPDDNVDGYRDGSPLHFAHQLEGRLLLAHGTGDDNVHYQGVEALIDRLVHARKHFELLVYPNRSHGIGEGQNTTLHLRESMFDFWKRNLFNHESPADADADAPQQVVE
jgi:dipeptidyl-peptidase-4